MRWYRAVALDLDGTLTSGGWPSAVVLDAIGAARRQGIRVLLVTGRILADLQLEFPGLVDRFDLVVAENGAVLRGPDWTRPLADPVPPGVLARLHEAGVRVRQGQVLLACDATADHIALDAVESLGLDVALVRNRAALNDAPPGSSGPVGRGARGQTYGCIHSSSRKGAAMFTSLVNRVAARFGRKRCPECGHKVNETFCDVCGYDLVRQTRDKGFRRVRY